MSHETTPRYMPGPFRAGDRCQLTDPKGKINTVSLKHGDEFHTHRGVVKHDDIIGLPDSSVVLNSSGVEYLVMRPLLVDFVMSMPRGAAIIYPKEAQAILGQADIFPGARVVEAGVGSGWYKYVGDSGEIISLDHFGASASAGELFKEYGFTPENIVAAALRTIARS